ncbi:hypothetical protein TSAR_016926 [Trichomalopsis sarcophagae]|uniref:Uncharacterized protein n=1 Tax=Trichomalopsis sarcophagae TaxID=543379 RepID=A0A232EIT8_9HYME|nr:hypothetical protein TSAR_016926 [Trichomalopsis sarcophagae]
MIKNKHEHFDPKEDRSPVLPQIKRRKIDWKSMIPSDDPNSLGSEYVPTNAATDESDGSDFETFEDSDNTKLDSKIKPFAKGTRKMYHADNEDNENCGESSTSSSQKNKQNELDKRRKKYLLKLYSNKATSEIEAPVNEGNALVEINENEQNKQNVNAIESESSSSTFGTSRFIAKSNVSSSNPNNNSLKLNRNGIDDLDLPTQTIAFSDVGVKWYTKLNCCCFCYSLEVTVDRLYISHHSNEPEVQFLLHCKVPSERRAKFKELGLRGNNFFNNDRTLNPKGLIICSRRVSRKKTIEKQRLLENNNKEVSPIANESTTESTIASSITSNTDHVGFASKFVESLPIVSPGYRRFQFETDIEKIIFLQNKGPNHFSYSKKFVDKFIDIKQLDMACLSRKELNRHTNDKALPQSKDIVIFREYLVKLRQQVLDNIKASENIFYDQYLTLMTCVALLIVTFNQRRNSEVAKTLLTDFYCIKKADKNSEFFQELSAEEKNKRINPDATRATALRKHAATVNGTIEHEKNTTMYAELLGHSERIQKSKYKRIVDKQDVEKVSFLKQIYSIRHNSENVPQQSQPEEPAQIDLDSSNEEVVEPTVGKI